MLTVDDYGQIRRARRDGLSIRAAARTFHHSRRTIREALACPEPKGYTRTKDPPAPKLGPYRPLIEEILRADEQAPPKQRHTAAQLFRILQHRHGYPGGYDQVRRYVQQRRRDRRETFIPLVHDPGERLECDFGHIYVDFPEGRKAVPVFLAVWAYSNCPFAVALPTERVEAILHGMVEGFGFFAGVPREVWWDNPKTVVTKIFPGRARTPHGRYAALASHYAFDPRFCMPASGNEKPYVENRVFDLQRRWATPVPKAADLAELNAYLRSCCLQERDRVVAGQTETIGQRFERDRTAAAPLPAHSFDPCDPQDGWVDKYQTVRFDSVRYSVPRLYAYRKVTIKGYVDHIKIAADGQVIARHERSYDPNRPGLDPIHFLVTLGRRPAALDHAEVYRRWRLPAAFLTLREALETRHGPTAGVRQYIRVLQLLAEHPVDRVQKAIERCPQPEDLNAECIIRHTQRLARRETASSATWAETEGLSPLLSIQVAMPDLSRFDQLLTPGELAYV